MAEESGGDKGMDPVTAGLVKAAAGAGAEASKETGRLLARVLGPSADEIGEALRRYTAFRLRNVARIAEKASRKTDTEGDSGEVPPRVAHRLLEEGSYCDDELMAEYLGGVLAASRTPGGRDDRAVVWSDLVTTLSTLQVRAHFLLYREWAAALKGRTDLNLGVDAGRDASELHVDVSEFVPALLSESSVPANAALTHAITGLVRLRLLGDAYAWGEREGAGFPQSPFEYPLVVNISVAGIELYGWAQGEAGMTGPEFVAEALVFGEEEVPRLRSVAMPKLPDLPEVSAGSDADPEARPEASPLP